MKYIAWLCYVICSRGHVRLLGRKQRPLAASIILPYFAGRRISRVHCKRPRLALMILSYLCCNVRTWYGHHAKLEHIQSGFVTMKNSSLAVVAASYVGSNVIKDKDMVICQVS